MKADAVRFVQTSNPPAHVRAEDAHHRLSLWGDHMDIHLARSKRGGDFQPDETRADDDDAFAWTGGRGNTPAVSDCAEVVDARGVRARNVEPHGLGPGG